MGGKFLRGFSYPQIPPIVFSWKKRYIVHFIFAYVTKNNHWLWRPLNYMYICIHKCIRIKQIFLEHDYLTLPCATSVIKRKSASERTARAKCELLSLALFRVEEGKASCPGNERDRDRMPFRCNGTTW